jgi:hypothetical protein
MQPWGRFQSWTSPEGGVSDPAPRTGPRGDPAARYTGSWRDRRPRARTLRTLPNPSGHRHPPSAARCQHAPAPGRGTGQEPGPPATSPAAHSAPVPVGVPDAGPRSRAPGPAARLRRTRLGVPAGARFAHSDGGEEHGGRASRQAAGGQLQRLPERHAASRAARRRARFRPAEVPPPRGRLRPRGPLGAPGPRRGRRGEGRGPHGDAGACGGRRVRADENGASVNWEARVFSFLSCGRAAQGPTRRLIVSHRRPPERRTFPFP